MNHIKTLVLILAVISLNYQNSYSKDKEKSGIEFHEGSWKEVLELAKKENKPIFLDISASWCGPCKLLKRTTFKNAEVAEFYNKNFINVEVDGEVGEGIDLAKKYKIPGYPSLIYLNSKGELLTLKAGYHSSSKFIEVGKTVLK